MGEVGVANLQTTGFNIFMFFGFNNKPQFYLDSKSNSQKYSIDRVDLFPIFYSLNRK